MSSHLNATDQQQIAIFRRVKTMLEAGLANIDTLIHRRDVAIALGDYATVLAESGGEVGEKIMDKLVDPADLNAQIVFGIQSLRRVSVAAMRDLGDIKRIAMNGTAPPAAVPPAEVPAPPSTDEEDDFAEELELEEEE